MLYCRRYSAGLFVDYQDDLAFGLWYAKKLVEKLSLLSESKAEVNVAAADAQRYSLY